MQPEAGGQVEVAARVMNLVEEPQPLQFVAVAVLPVINKIGGDKRQRRHGDIVRQMKESEALDKLEARVYVDHRQGTRSKVDGEDSQVAEAVFQAMVLPAFQLGQDSLQRHKGEGDG